MSALNDPSLTVARVTDQLVAWEQSVAEHRRVLSELEPQLQELTRQDQHDGFFALQDPEVEKRYRKVHDELLQVQAEIARRQSSLQEGTRQIRSGKMFLKQAQVEELQKQLEAARAQVTAANERVGFHMNEKRKAEQEAAALSAKVQEVNRALANAQSELRSLEA